MGLPGGPYGQLVAMELEETDLLRPDPVGVPGQIAAYDDLVVIKPELAGVSHHGVEHSRGIAQKRAIVRRDDRHEIACASHDEAASRRWSEQRQRLAALDELQPDGEQFPSADQRVARI